MSYRDVEDLLAERSLDISYETTRRWFLKFGGPIAHNLRRRRPTPSDYWHPKIVSERLDHSSIAITLDTYSHVLPGMQEQTIEALDASLAAAIDGDG